MSQLHPNYLIGGCDVSYWQATIDFDTLLDRDIWFMIARASVGDDLDTRYQPHKLGAIGHGLPVGCYHYWMPGYSVDANVAALTSTQPTRPPMGVWLDLEGKGFTITKRALSEHIYQCLQRLDEHYGVMTGLYTRASWWDYWIDEDYYNLIDASSRPLWVAQYFYEFQPAPTDIPRSWPGAHIWQYSAEQGPYAGQASEFGITGSASLDIDAWLGTLQEFQIFTSTIVEPPEELPLQIKTITNANIRNAPLVDTKTDVGDTPSGSVFDVIGEEPDWWKVQAYIAKSVSTPVIVPPPPSITGYYVAHDFLEVTLPNGKKMPSKGKVRAVAPNPEVFWLDETMVQLTAPWQRLIYEMNQPYMSEKSFTQNLASNVAWANGTGFNEVGDPRNNYITGVMGKKDPFLDKCRVCGGAIIRGTESNGMLTVEVLDGSQPPPKWEDLKLKPWLWFRAYIVNIDGSVFDFPYCGGQPLYMPLVGIPPVVVKLNFSDTDRPAIPYIVRI